LKAVHNILLSSVEIIETKRGVNLHRPTERSACVGTGDPRTMSSNQGLTAAHSSTFLLN